MAMVMGRYKKHFQGGHLILHNFFPADTIWKNMPTLMSSLARLQQLANSWLADSSLNGTLSEGLPPMGTCFESLRVADQVRVCACCGALHTPGHANRADSQV